MAKKRNTNKFGHAFVCEWLGKNWFRDEQGKITDEAGTYAGDTFNKLINDQYPIVMPDDVEKKPKKKRKEKVSIDTAKPKPEDDGESEGKPSSTRSKRILKALYPDLFAAGEKLREVWTGEKETEALAKKGKRTKKAAAKSGKDIDEEDEEKGSTRGGRIFDMLYPGVREKAGALKKVWTGDKKDKPSKDKPNKNSIDKDEEQKGKSEKKRQDTEKRFEYERVEDSLNDNADLLRGVVAIQQRSADLLTQILEKIGKTGVGGGGPNTPGGGGWWNKLKNIATSPVTAALGVGALGAYGAYKAGQGISEYSDIPNRDDKSKLDPSSKKPDGAEMSDAEMREQAFKQRGKNMGGRQAAPEKKPETASKGDDRFKGKSAEEITEVLSEEYGDTMIAETEAKLIYKKLNGVTPAEEAAGVKPEKKPKVTENGVTSVAGGDAGPKSKAPKWIQELAAKHRVDPDDLEFGMYHPNIDVKSDLAAGKAGVDTPEGLKAAYAKKDADDAANKAGAEKPNYLAGVVSPRQMNKDFNEVAEPPKAAPVSKSKVTEAKGDNRFKGKSYEEITETLSDEYGDTMIAETKAKLIYKKLNNVTPAEETAGIKPVKKPEAITSPATTQATPPASPSASVTPSTAPSPTLTPPPVAVQQTDIATSKETSAIAEAKQKQVKAEDILTFKGEEIKFNADRLTFEVQTLTIENKGQPATNATKPTQPDEGSAGGGGGATPKDTGGAAGGGGTGAAPGGTGATEGKSGTSADTAAGATPSTPGGEVTGAPVTGAGKGKPTTPSEPPPTLTEEQKKDLGALSGEGIKSDDPRAKQYSGLSEDQLKSAGIEKTPDGGFKQAPTAASGMTDEEIAKKAGTGKFRPEYKLSDKDLSDDVLNTIAGEARMKDPASVDAVINNMFNRVGAKGYGPSADLQQVARAPGQYEGYRKATEKEKAMLRERIQAVAAGNVEDTTKGADQYRATSYMKGAGAGKTASRTAAEQKAEDLGGNTFFKSKNAQVGPYAAYQTTGQEPPPSGPATPEQIAQKRQKLEKQETAQRQTALAAALKQSPKQTVEANDKNAIIAMGTNDAGGDGKGDISKVYDNTLKAIEDAKKKGLNPVVIPPNKDDPRFARAAAEVERAAKEADVKVEQVKYDPKDPLHMLSSEAKRLNKDYDKPVPIGDSNAVRVGMAQGMKTSGPAGTALLEGGTAQVGASTSKIAGSDKTPGFTSNAPQQAAVREKPPEMTAAFGRGGGHSTGESFELTKSQREQQFDPPEPVTGAVPEFNVGANLLPPDATKLPGGDEGMKDRDVRSANMENVSNTVEKESNAADLASSQAAGYETSFDVGTGSQGAKPVAESIPQPPRRPADLTAPPPESSPAASPPSPKAQAEGAKNARQISLESHSPKPGGNGAEFLESVFKMLPYLLHQKKHAPQVGRRWHY